MAGSKSQPQEKKKDTKAAKRLKRAGLERQLPIAREKVKKARKAVDAAKLEGEAKIAKARAELDLAEARLATFDEREAPNRLGRTRLGLRQAEDSLADAQEELEQLELMYKEQDLADKTREIVIRRAKRRLERSRERLALQKAQLVTLEKHTLPNERKKLALEVTTKKNALKDAQRSLDSGLHEKRIALMSAEAEVARIEAELASLREELR